MNVIMIQMNHDTITVSHKIQYHLNCKRGDVWETHCALLVSFPSFHTKCAVTCTPKSKIQRNGDSATRTISFLFTGKPESYKRPCSHNAATIIEVNKIKVASRTASLYLTVHDATRNSGDAAEAGSGRKWKKKEKKKDSTRKQEFHCSGVLAYWRCVRRRWNVRHLPITR